MASPERDYLFAMQRLERGWDDSETWDLGETIAKFALPRLVRYRELTCGYPPHLNDIQEWYDILDKIIEAFKPEPDYDEAAVLKYYQDRVEGLKLFAEYFNNLWW